MNKYFLNLMRGALLILDLLSINAGFITVNYFFRKQLLINVYVEYNNFFLFLNISWIAIALICKIYSEKNVLTFETFARNSMNAFIYFMGLIFF